MDEIIIKLEEKVVDTNVDKFANWFKDNPEKILGDTLIKTSTIRGKENAFTYTTVISDKEKLFALDIPDYMQVSNDDPLISTEKDKITETSANPTLKRTIKKADEKSEKDNAQILRRFGKAFVPSKNIWSYDEVDETYNGDRYDQDGNLIEKAITESQKQAYVLYIKRFTGKEIKGGFKKYLIEDTKENRLKLMKEGSLAFDNTENEEFRRFKPTFYYASGNIREKIQSLKNGKDFYVNNFGEDVYENQLRVLNEKLEIVNEKKLTLTSKDPKKRIYIKVDGGFAKQIKVSPCIPINTKSYQREESTWIRLNKDGNIEWKVNKTAKGYAPDKRSGRDAEFGTYKLTLRQAFIFWYKDFSRWTASDYNIIYPIGVNYDNIMDWFVNGKGQRTKNIPDKYKELSLNNTAIIKDEWYAKLQQIKDVGNKLFALFLEIGLQEKDVINIVTTWNTKYNSFLNYNVNKVPILFQFVKNVAGGTEQMDIRTEKRRAIGFNMLTGSSCLAYGVGMGKTFASIFTLGQNLDLGLCKRPLIIVPNSVYPQFLQEIKFLLPQYKVNGLFNLKGILSTLAENVQDNSITIISKSAIDSLGFSNKETGDKLLKRYFEILKQGDDDDDENKTKKTEKKKSSDFQKFKEFLGVVQSNSTVFFDKIGWDYLCIDEAHNFKNLFASVKGKLKEDEGESGNEKIVTTRQNSGFKIKGSQSPTAVKIFALAQYVQMQNRNGNCLLLTATPFTNTPLEIYSMLSLIRYDFLKANGYGAIQDFFEFFAEVGNVSAVTTALKPVNKTVVTGFKNVVAMQGIIYALIDKPTKEEEATKVERPNKIVLPMWDKKVANQTIKVSESNQVTTLLKMTSTQTQLWERLTKYSEGKLKYAELSAQEYWNNSKCSSIEAMLKSAKKKAEEGETPANYDAGGIQSVFTLTYGRSIALSPYLYRFFPVEKNPTPAEFVQASPKIEYAIECIKTVKEHHEKTKTPMSGQVIFMTKGVSCFNYITDYCVDYLGLKEHEVGIIASKNYIGKNTKGITKDNVQDAFLGRRLDVTDPLNPKYVDIPDEDRVKVLVGSTAIKEGVNLQFYSTCLYVCEVDWNPTDMTQLEGRIWRQKNAFENVRIVIPLLENSLDAFIYNKLKEKTGRINQIWERDGSNEFELDELNPEEMTRQVSRSPSQIADIIKKQRNKEFSEQLTEYTVQYNSFREVRRLSGEIIDVYNDISKYSRKLYNHENTLQMIWNFLNTFRPSLIDKPLVKEKSSYDKLFSPTPTQESRSLKVNPNELNYSFEDLTELMNVFRKDAIIEYPRGYMSGWKEETEKAIPTFKVGEKVTFETRRGAKEGKIFEVFSYNYGNDPKNLEYDIQVGLDPDNISEGVKTIDNKIVSLDNPIKEVENVDLGGTAFNIGSKKATETLMDIYNWFKSNNKKENIEQTLDYYKRMSSPYLTAINFYSLERTIQSFQSFAKIKEFFYDNFLRVYDYDIKWTRWIKEINDYWNKNLIPLGIKNEDELTIKLKELKTKTSLFQTKLEEIDSDEFFEGLKIEAQLEIKKRAEDGDKPLSPIEGADLFAKPNPDYLGNGYLDIFTKKFLKKKEYKKQKSKIEEAKVVEEKPKELSLIDKKIKVFEMLVKTSKGAKKDLLEKKINVFKMFRK